MVPGVIVKLSEMPLTANGKINRSALPDADGLRIQLSGVYVAPQNEAEMVIASLWQDALHLDKVGIHDNFFDLGGHSLLMLDIHAALQQRFKSELVLLEMFKYPTVASLAQYLSEGQSQSPTFEKVNERAEKQREVMSRQRRQNGRRRSGVNE
jgi:acyl carrier protein